ncbi:MULTISPECIES: arylamine N-acetyltransferase family protein [Staphylococcus]|uniref:arylamine N-acetyltransferase family protein n=1 Tax=Staphylococcus TaxID=1279 RepID=UPI003AAD7BAC
MTEVDFTKLEHYLKIENDLYHQTDLETLNHYIHQYVMHVPFENINVQNGEPIALNDEAMLEKIVDQHRGGYCYEQNHFFHNYLKSKGFEVYIVAGTVANGDAWAKEGSHMALIVKLDSGKYIVDVGYADVPTVALPIEGTVVNDVTGQFRIQQTEAHQYELQKFQSDEWQTQYKVIDETKEIAHFSEGIYFNQYDSESLFVQQLLVSKAKTFGRITLFNQQLMYNIYGQKMKKSINQSEYKKILQNDFGISNIKIKPFEK